jgi:hypothetical protein
MWLLEVEEPGVFGAHAAGQQGHGKKRASHGDSREDYLDMQIIRLLEA